MRIVRLANFVAPRSGGLRTAMRHLGEQFVQAGHEPVLVVPGPRRAETATASGLRVELPGPPVPGLGYRVLVARRAVREALSRLEPDVIEVSDRTTLRWVGAWARARAIPTVMVSHESLAGLLAAAPLPPSLRRRAADRLNAATARQFDLVLCTTQWAAREFDRIAVTNLVRAPLGVDLDAFHPRHHDPTLRARYAFPGQPLLVYCGRLSPEKRVDRPIEALRLLRREGIDAVLIMAGDGPSRGRLITRAAGLPVRFVGHLADRRAIAALLATADVVIAPSPIETFGLAALEGLASGTPVVFDRASALVEVVGDAGLGVDGTAAAFAHGVRLLLDRPPAVRAQFARRRAEEYGWPEAAAAFVTAYDRARALAWSRDG